MRSSSLAVRLTYTLLVLLSLAVCFTDACVPTAASANIDNTTLIYYNERVGYMQRKNATITVSENGALINGMQFSVIKMTSSADLCKRWTIGKKSFMTMANKMDFIEVDNDYHYVVIKMPLELLILGTTCSTKTVKLWRITPVADVDYIECLSTIIKDDRDCYNYPHCLEKRYDVMLSPNSRNIDITKPMIPEAPAPGSGGDDGDDATTTTTTTEAPETTTAPSDDAGARRRRRDTTAENGQEAIESSGAATLTETITSSVLGTLARANVPMNFWFSRPQRQAPPPLPSTTTTVRSTTPAAAVTPAPVPTSLPTAESNIPMNQWPCSRFSSIPFQGLPRLNDPDAYIFALTRKEFVRLMARNMVNLEDTLYAITHFGYTVMTCERIAISVTCGYLRLKDLDYLINLAVRRPASLYCQHKDGSPMIEDSQSEGAQFETLGNDHATAEFLLNDAHVLRKLVIDSVADGTLTLPKYGVFALDLDLPTIFRGLETGDIFPVEPFAPEISVDYQDLIAERQRARAASCGSGGGGLLGGVLDTVSHAIGLDSSDEVSVISPTDLAGGLTGNGTLPLVGGLLGHSSVNLPVVGGTGTAPNVVQGVGGLLGSIPVVGGGAGGLLGNLPVVGGGLGNSAGGLLGNLPVAGGGHGAAGGLLTSLPVVGSSGIKTDLLRGGGAAGGAGGVGGTVGSLPIIGGGKSSGSGGGGGGLLGGLLKTVTNTTANVASVL